MAAGTIVVAGAPPEVLPRLGEIVGFDVRVVDRLDATLDGLGEVVAIAGRVPAAVIDRAPRLRWVHSWAAGPDADLSPELAAHDSIMTSSAGNGAIPLAEHAMMLMLQLDRDERRWALAQRERRWEWRMHSELAGKTIGLYGLGNAGRDLAVKAAAFHMRVLGCRRDARSLVDGVERLYAPQELHAFLAECDVVVVTAPLTAETRGAFDAAAFRAMKPTAFWICVSRGGIAVDEDLLTALREGWIAGAGIDAHAMEPLPEDSEFWDAPNTIVTPHNGASSPGTRRRGAEIFLENVRRFGAEAPLRNIVDKAVGY